MPLPGPLLDLAEALPVLSLWESLMVAKGMVLGLAVAFPADVRGAAKSRWVVDLREHEGALVAALGVVAATWAADPSIRVGGVLGVVVGALHSLTVWRGR